MNKSDELYLEALATEIQEQCQAGASVSDVMQILRGFSEPRPNEFRRNVIKALGFQLPPPGVDLADNYLIEVIEDLVKFAETEPEQPQQAVSDEQVIGGTAETELADDDFTFLVEAPEMPKQAAWTEEDVLEMAATEFGIVAEDHVILSFARALLAKATAQPTPAVGDWAADMRKEMAQRTRNQAVSPAYAEWLDEQAKLGIESHGGNEIWNAATMRARLSAPAAQQPIGYVVPFEWKNRETERVVKLTRDPQPEHGFTVPVAAQQPSETAIHNARKALDVAYGCFEAAFAEGLDGVLLESEDERLKGLVKRRLLYAVEAIAQAQAALETAIQQAVREAREEWEADKAVCEKLIWKEAIEAAATVLPTIAEGVCDFDSTGKHFSKKSETVDIEEAQIAIRSLLRPEQQPSDWNAAIEEAARLLDAISNDPKNNNQIQVAAVWCADRVRSLLRPEQQPKQNIVWSEEIDAIQKEAFTHALSGGHLYDLYKLPLRMSYHRKSVEAAQEAERPQLQVDGKAVTDAADKCGRVDGARWVFDALALSMFVSRILAVATVGEPKKCKD